MHDFALSLRPARDDDGPALAQLIAACFAEYEGCLYASAEFPELAAPASHYVGRGGFLRVATEGERLVGSLAAVPVPEQGAVEVSKVYLAAALRGRGGAQRLMAEAESFAAALGARRLVLWSDTRFARAHRFYEKLGFTPQPVTRYLADVSRTWEFRYERALAPR